MIRPRRPVRQKAVRPKRAESTEPFDKWLKEAASLKASDPEKYERETKDVVKIAVEVYERKRKRDDEHK